MDCETEEGRASSMEKFRNATSIKQVRTLWSKFYINEICIPNYSSTFIGDPINEAATMELGQRMKYITNKLEVFMVNSQPALLDQSDSEYFVQREYLSLITTEKLGRALISYLNLIPHIVALEYVEGVNFWVTYDGLGNPFTHVYCSDIEEEFSEVVSADVYRKLKAQYTCRIFIVNTDIGQNRIIDALMHFIKKTPSYQLLSS